MNQSLILDLLENNARLSSQDLADILNEDEASIKSEIQSLEKIKSFVVITRLSTTTKH